MSRNKRRSIGQTAVLYPLPSSKYGSTKVNQYNQLDFKKSVLNPNQNLAHHQTNEHAHLSMMRRKKSKRTLTIAVDSKI